MSERGDMGHLAISDESDDTFAAMIDAEGLRRHTYGTSPVLSS